MAAIERENPSLKGVLPDNYARPALDKQRLGELIDLIGTIGLGDRENRSRDILGRVCEYFLGQFADAQGKKGGQFYTPKSIVTLLVEMLEPFHGRVYDPCCGSGGMFVQSERFVEAHGGKIDDISIYGQENNQTTWRLCKMNLAIRAIDGNIAWAIHLWKTNTRICVRISSLPIRRSMILTGRANCFVMIHAGNTGCPPAGNANFAWVQHFIYHLSPNGIAGVVLANGSMSSRTGGEGEIRKNIIEADLVDCMVALPSQLFYNTTIPACLWFIAKNKKDGYRTGDNFKFRDRSGEVLFIDARKMGVMVDRRHRELTPEEIKKIADTYHAWRGELVDSKKLKYRDIPGFCRSVKLDEIRKHDYILTPGRYVGTEEMEEDDEEFEEKMQRLLHGLKQQMEEARKLDEEIRKNFKSLNLKF